MIPHHLWSVSVRLFEKIFEGLEKLAMLHLKR